MHEEYLTVNELSSRIKYSKQSIYNLIHRGTLVLGTHFFKPTPKKLLFKWAAIKKWIGDTPPDSTYTPPKIPVAEEQPKSLINI